MKGKQRERKSLALKAKEKRVIEVARAKDLSWRLALQERREKREKRERRKGKDL